MGEERTGGKEVYDLGQFDENRDILVIWR